MAEFMDEIPELVQPGAGVAVFTRKGDLQRIDERAKELLKGLLVDGRPSEGVRGPIEALASAVSTATPAAIERAHRLPGGGWIRLTFARTGVGDGMIVLVVRRLMAGAETFEAEANDAGLTPREREVARLAVRGDGTREIAHELGSSPTTVKHQLGSIFKKTGTTNRTELAALFLGGIRR